MEALGGGLVALAFWGFIASCVVGGIWYAIREKEAQHETLRRIIESGKNIDADLVDRIMSRGGDPERDLRVAALITLSAAPGLAVLGWFLSGASEKAFTALLGVAGLVFFVSLGLFAAARAAGKPGRQRDDGTLL